MRQRITRAATLRKLAALVGHEIESAMVRGGTNNRVDVFCLDGTSWNVYPHRRPLEVYTGKWRRHADGRWVYNNSDSQEAVPVA